MVFYKLPMASKLVAVILLIWQVTIATILPAKNTLNFSFKRLLLKNELGDPHFLLSNCNNHDKFNLTLKNSAE